MLLKNIFFVDDNLNKLFKNIFSLFFESDPRIQICFSHMHIRVFVKSQQN